MIYTSISNIQTPVSRLGMGCWAVGGHGWGPTDDNESIRAIQCAADSGVNFFDTADVYGLGKSEELLSKALGSNRHKMVIATKGGMRWESPSTIRVDTSPEYLRSAVEKSLRRLKLDTIPLYYIHKPDHTTPLNKSIEALAKLQSEGKLQAIGVSNFSLQQLLDATSVARISALQLRLNLLEPSLLFEFKSVCESQNIQFVAFGALADGLLTGKFSEEVRFSDDDHRKRMAIFQGPAFAQNLRRVKELQNWSQKRNINLNQLALRWILDSSSHTIALFGAKTATQVSQNQVPDHITLSQPDFDEIKQIVEATD